MANISLDNQIFFSGGQPKSKGHRPRREGPPIASSRGQTTLRQDAHDSQRGPPAPSLVNVVEMTSDGEFDYGGLGEGRLDTSSPRIDELSPLVTPEPQSDRDAGTSKSPNSREPSVTEIAACRGLAFESAQDDSEKTPLAGPSCAIMSSRSQEPRGLDTVAFALPSSPGISSSSTRLEVGSTHGVDDRFGARPARATDVRHKTGSQDAVGQYKTELVGLHGSGSDRDSRSPPTSREESRPRDRPSYLDPVSPAERWGKEYPLSPRASRTRLRHHTQLDQQETYIPGHFPAAPATVLPRRLPGLTEAMVEDEPASQDSTSSEARKTSRSGDNAGGTVATGGAYPVLPVVEASALRLEDGTHRESRPTRVSPRGGRGNHYRAKQEGARKSAASRHSIRDSVDPDDNSADADSVQQPVADAGASPQRRKRRRVSSRREGRPRQRDAEEIVTSPEDSGSEWDGRPPKQRYRRHATAAGRQTSKFEIAEDRGLWPCADPEAVKALSAKLAESLFATADVRSAKVDGVTVFQIRFKQDLYCSEHRHPVLSNPQPAYTSNSPARRRSSKPGHSKSQNERVISSDAADDPKDKVKKPQRRRWEPSEEEQLSAWVEQGKEWGWIASQLERSQPAIMQHWGIMKQNQKTIEDKNPLPSQTENDQTEYEVEKILDVEERGNGRARVKWAHFGEPTWEPLEEFLGTEALLAYVGEHGQISPR